MASLYFSHVKRKKTKVIMTSKEFSRIKSNCDILLDLPLKISNPIKSSNLYVPLKDYNYACSVNDKVVSHRTINEKKDIQLENSDNTSTHPYILFPFFPPFD